MIALYRLPVWGRLLVFGLALPAAVLTQDAPAAGGERAAQLTPLAVGPTGLRAPLRRSIAHRPEDAPPALPPSLPAVIDQRVDPAVKPTTFRGPATAAELAFEDHADPASKLASVHSTEEPATETSAIGEAPREMPLLEKDREAAATKNEANTSEADEDPRRLLASPSRKAEPASKDATPSLADFSWMPKPSLSMSSTVAATALTCGLLLMMFAVFRRALPKSARPLPQDVVRVLGRMPLANKQSAQLMRIGGKLVLVSVGVDGAKPITEITDPEEVARLTGLVEQASPQGASAAFQEVFAEVAKQPASPGFLGQDSASLFSTPPALNQGQIAAAYANTPGGRAHA